MLGNPYLESESSTNHEASALWKSGTALSGGVTVFYNDFKNKLSTLTTTRRCDGYIVMDRINIDSATIAGAEFNAAWDVNRQLRIKGNFTFTDSKQKSGANVGAPLALTPERMDNLRVDWQIPGIKASVGVAANHCCKEFGITLSAKPASAYTTADVGGSYILSPSVTLNVAL